MRNIEIKENILFQLEMCWQLYLYHMDNIEESEAKNVSELGYGRLLYAARIK